MESSHWLCISTIDFSTNTVHVYNSLKERVSINLLKQVSLLLETDCKNVKLIENTQIQKDGSDCGLFANHSNYTLLCDVCNKMSSLMRNHLNIFVSRKEKNISISRKIKIRIIWTIDNVKDYSTVESCCLSLLLIEMTLMQFIVRANGSLEETACWPAGSFEHYQFADGSDLYNA